MPRPVPRASKISRDEVRLDDLERQVEREGFDLPSEQLVSASWTLEPPAAQALMEKIRARGTPLAEYAGVKPYYGIKTGLNKAFLVDTATRERLVTEDGRSTEILKPYLRGEDVRRWRVEWSGQWMIFARHGIDIQLYPAVLRHLQQFRERLEPRPAEASKDEWLGRKPGDYAWYEVQDTVDYWRLLEGPKIVYQDIAWQSKFALDDGGLYCNNTLYFLPTEDSWLLAVLNSSPLWWYAWRTAQHGKDEALRFFSPFVEALPLPRPDDVQRETAARVVKELVLLRDEGHSTRSALLDWLAVEHEVTKPSQKLAELFSLSLDNFVEQVRQARGKQKLLSAAALRNLREEHARTIAPLAQRFAEAARLEAELSDLVCEAYGLTPEEIELMWQTAPPRMPILPPPQETVSARVLQTQP